MSGLLSGEPLSEVFLFYFVLCSLLFFTTLLGILAYVTLKDMKRHMRGAENDYVRFL